MSTTHYALAHIGLLVSPDDIPEAAAKFDAEGEAKYKGYAVRRESPGRMLIVLQTIRVEDGDIWRMRVGRVPSLDAPEVQRMKYSLGDLWHPDNFVFAVEQGSF